MKLIYRGYDLEEFSNPQSYKIFQDGKLVCMIIGSLEKAHAWVDQRKKSLNRDGA